MTYELPPLPYSNDALEPYIDSKTMDIHYNKHHEAYITNLNAALAKLSDKNVSDLSIEEILKNVSKYPVAVRNNAGGHYNHSLFWTVIKPGGRGQPGGNLGHLIDDAFGSFDSFKTTFSIAATDRF